MRVAHIITRMIIGGAQENTLYNCQDLVEIYGDDVLLITGPSTGPEGDLLSDECRQQGRAGGVKISVIESMRRAIHPFNDWKTYSQLKRVLKEFNPDVVHTHSAKGGMLGRMAAWKLKVPAVIHSVHGAPFHPYQSAVARQTFRSCEKYAARRCHAMISVADAMTDLMVEANIAPREKFTTIFSGMDVEPFLKSESMRAAARAELGFGLHDVVVGKIARLFHLKGHEYLIQAAPRIVAANPNVRFLLVGDGILKGDFEKQIDAAGLSRHFVFTGLVAPEKIPKLISAMDMLAHVSLREGLARTLPQALISGKPVVCFDVDGGREVCITNETGILVDAEDVDGLAGAIIRLVNDAALRSRLGRAGRSRFTEQFRHEFMTQQIRRVYKKVLTENGMDLREFVREEFLRGREEGK